LEFAIRHRHLDGMVTFDLPSYKSSLDRLSREEADKVIQQHKIEVLREAFSLLLKNGELEKYITGYPKEFISAEKGEELRFRFEICFKF